MPAFPKFLIRHSIEAGREQKEVTMAEINKLSVGQALDKLRNTNVKISRITRLDEEMKAIDKETQRLRAQRRRLERDQGGPSQT